MKKFRSNRSSISLKQQHLMFVVISHLTHKLQSLQMASDLYYKYHRFPFRTGRDKISQIHFSLRLRRFHSNSTFYEIEALAIVAKIANGIFRLLAQKKIMAEIRLTVEQVYLIQQLMKSGMSKEEIVKAVCDPEEDEQQTSPEDSTSTQVSNSETVSESAVASVNNAQTSRSECTQSSSAVAVSPTPVEEQEEYILPCSSSTEELFTRKTTTIEYEESEALKSFKTKGDDTILREIRKFVSAYNISQITIADMIRVSQGYVSRYMNGDFDQVSERVKNLVYLWYIECRRNPNVLKQCLGNRAVMSESGVLLPIKRDKFKFHKCQIDVLERFFNKDNYPSNETKKLIVEMCNYSLAKLENRQLDDSEKVTINLVNNWFNNRRKGLKVPQSSQ